MLNLMKRKTLDDKGVTLVEVLAVLVLTVMIAGLLTYILNFAHSSLRQIAVREDTLQQSRDIVQHIAASVRRSGFFPDSAQLPLTGANNLLLVKDEHQFIHYTWTPGTGSDPGTLQMVSQLDGATSPSTHLFSEQIVRAEFSVTPPGAGDSSVFKYSILLEVQLPNNQTRVTTTTLLSSNR